MDDLKSSVLHRPSDPAVPPSLAGEISCDKDKHEFNGNGYQHNLQTAVGLLLVLFGRTFASSEQSFYCLHSQDMHVKDQATLFVFKSVFSFLQEAPQKLHIIA